MIRFAFEHRRSADGFRLQAAGQIPLGKTTALFGDSGAGKTTFLRILAGLEPSVRGHLSFGEDVWLAGRRQCPAQRRGIGMVFQDYALFPERSVRGNVAFGARREDAPLVDELLSLTGLAAFADKRPQALSGGQRQRVALARALACRPRLLLLDEPTSSLERALRQSLQQMLLAMQARMGFTMVLVSHDLAEVFSLADHVLRLEQGDLVASGTPEALFLSPGNGPCRLPAVLLALRRAKDSWQASFQLGQDIVELSVDAAQAARLTPGQRVVLAAGNLGLAAGDETVPADSEKADM